MSPQWRVDTPPASIWGDWGRSVNDVTAWLVGLDLSLVVDLGVFALCGGLIGLERQIRGKPIGIRTSVLICLGTGLFVRLGMSFDTFAADPTRVLGQVATGIGFLGAGVIVARAGTITGVTSAAVVWVLAAIGSTIGVGRRSEAIILSVFTVSMLIGVRLLERAFKGLAGGAARAAQEPSAQDLEE
jgi:putative Mg2+ transporter-C (MgtC) family protein